jgi:hypothetical protein
MRLPSITSYVFYLIEVEAACSSFSDEEWYGIYDGGGSAIERLLDAKCGITPLALLSTLSFCGSHEQ